MVDPLINLTIDDRYRVSSRIARGGMASVYLAMDQRLDRPVALKVMHPHLAESGQFTARFQREARSAAKISHPGVVPVFDQGVFHGQGYLVMELIDGPNLRAVLDSDGPLALGQSLSYVEEVLTAVQAAHEVGVVHRDLKPENVLVSTQGDLKVVDFGLARAATEIALSTTGSIMGTVAYLAPEVAQSGQSDERTDIFSIGLMLYEMVTGTVPWVSDNPINTAYARVHEDAPPPSSLVDWLPTEVDDLISALCARDPQERPATAAEALSLVRRVHRDLPTDLLRRRAPALPQPEGQPTTGTERLHPFDKTTSLPIERQVVHTSGALVASGAKAPTRARRTSIIVVILLLIVAGLAGGTWWWLQYGPGSYVEIPNIQGKTQVQAELALDELNLVYLVAEESSDDVPQGSVISTSPKAGDRIHKNGTVDVLVSAGVKMVTVPPLVNLPRADAEAALKAAELTVGTVTEVWSETVAAGIVVSSTPEAKKSIRHDSNVALEVSKGRQPIEVPGLVGLAADEAEALISDRGLTSDRKDAYSDDVEEGLVISQNPAAGGDTLYLGDTVTWTVSLGPELVKVPDVERKQLTEAQALLENAGFKVEVKRIASFFDTVGGQDPAPGTSVRRGSTITLTVV